MAATLPVLLEPNRSWRVTASHSALTAVGATAEPYGAFSFEGWTTGRPQEPGMWFQIELPETVPLTEIEFISPAQGGGGRQGVPPRRASPRQFHVEVSTDGNAWSTAAEGEGDAGATTTIVFQPVRARFVRITQTAQTENPPVWTMQRLKLYRQAGS
jgi:hypothetical protein